MSRHNDRADARSDPRNSGSGKTTTAREVRHRYGRGCALEQDYLRRTMLREHDTSRANPVAPAFITATARNALDLGYHVVMEGILHTGRAWPRGTAGPAFLAGAGPAAGSIGC
jgi:hypothetical protein